MKRKQSEIYIEINIYIENQKSINDVNSFMIEIYFFDNTVSCQFCVFTKQKKKYFNLKTYI